MTGWYKVKKIYVGSRQVRPKRFEYSYDFRDKTATQLANDGWNNTSWITLDSNWITASSWHNCLNTVSWLWDAVANAKIITMEIQAYKPSSSWGISWITIIKDSNVTAQTWTYYDYYYFDVMANGNDLYKPSYSTSSWTKNITCVYDLVNKTYSWNFVWGLGTFSWTLTDTQIAWIKTCWIARIVFQSVSYVQTIKIIVE